MTPKERAAMQQALEALEQYHYTLISAGVLDKQHVLNQGFTAHAALREALAEQAEQKLSHKLDTAIVEATNLEQRIDAALEMVTQEPVAWMHKCGDVCSAYDKEHMFGLGYFNIPLYAAPPRTKDLTDDEIMKINVDTASIVPTCDRQFHFARAVIAKYKEKQK